MRNFLKKFCLILGTILVVGAIFANCVEATDANYRFSTSTTQITSYDKTGLNYTSTFYCDETFYLCVYDSNATNTLKYYSIKIYDSDGNLEKTFSTKTITDVTDNYSNYVITLSTTGEKTIEVTATSTSFTSYIGSGTIEVYDREPVITSQPSAISVKNGLTTTFSVSASGTHNSYQWYYNTTGSTSSGTAISEATSSSYTVTTTKSMNGRYYYCKIANENESNTTVTSSAAKLTVYYAPTITSPSAQSVKMGETVTFSVTASEDGNPSDYSYQWYYATSSSGSGTKISGKTDSSLSISATKSMNGRYYYCKVSNGQYSVTSSRAKLTVYYTHSISTQPTAQTVLGGKTATFTVAVSGGNPSSYTYQWYKATSSSATGTSISGATDASYSVTTSSSDNGYYYYCKVSNGQYSVTSSRAKLNVLTISVNNVTYTGSALEPTVTVKAGSTTLTKGTDYTLSYSNNTNAGTGKVTVTCVGDYSGTFTKTFTINKASYTPTIKAYSGTYDGKSHTITISGVKSGSTIKYKTSSSGTYSTTKPTRTNVGTTTVYYQITNSNYNTVTGSKTIKVTAKSISGFSATLSSTSYTYNGSAKKPTVTLKNGSSTIGSSNYTVSYSNNTNAGTGKVTIKGKGNYTGNLTKTFTINKAAQTITTSASSYKKTYGSSFSLGTSRKGDGKTTYSSSNSKIASVNSNGKVTIKGYGKATITVKVAAGTNYKSATKKITVTGIPKKVSSSNLSIKKTSTKLKPTWTKDSTVTGYQVQYSTSSNFSSYKSAKVTSNKTSTISGLTKGKKYYVRIKAYKTVSGTKYYGEWLVASVTL